MGNAKFMKGRVRVVTLPSKRGAAEGVDPRREGVVYRLSMAARSGALLCQGSRRLGMGRSHFIRKILWLESGANCAPRA